MITFGPHLIDFADLPRREANDRTPRIIGRLTEAGATIRDNLPDGQCGIKFNPRGQTLRRGALKRLSPAYPAQALLFVVQLLSGQARQAGFKAYTPELAIDIRPAGHPELARAPEWHRDGPEFRMNTPRYILGTADPTMNAQFATINVPQALLPFFEDSFRTAGSAADDRVTQFLQQANAIAQIGSNEILELFGDTPHRSSPDFAYNKGDWRFIYYDFS